MWHRGLLVRARCPWAAVPRSCPRSASPLLAWHHPTAPLQGWEITAGLGLLPLAAPSQLVVREGKLTASNYPGPLVMTLCPLQFPWDTVPLLPSSPELRGTKLASQNRPFFGTKKIGVETMLAQLARAGSWQGERCESLGKEELCISLTAFLCYQGT